MSVEIAAAGGPIPATGDESQVRRGRLNNGNPPGDLTKVPVARDRKHPKGWSVAGRPAGSMGDTRRRHGLSGVTLRST